MGSKMGHVFGPLKIWIHGENFEAMKFCPRNTCLERAFSQSDSRQNTCDAPSDHFRLQRKRRVVLLSLTGGCPGNLCLIGFLPAIRTAPRFIPADPAAPSQLTSRPRTSPPQAQFRSHRSHQSCLWLLDVQVSCPPQLGRISCRHRTARAKSI